MMTDPDGRDLATREARTEYLEQIWALRWRVWKARLAPLQLLTHRTRRPSTYIVTVAGWLLAKLIDRMGSQ